jgi:hypothetical protein
MPITVAARSKAWTVFARSNTGIVGSNPIWGIDVSVYVVLCAGSGLATGWSPVQAVLPSVYTDQETEKAAKAQQRAVEPKIERYCVSKYGAMKAITDRCV